MSYRNSIRDISPGSLWIDEYGELVTVAHAAAGYVLLPVRCEGEHFTIIPERRFRLTHSPAYAREGVRSQFTMSLANLLELTAYWLPERRKLVCRSRNARRRFSVPPAAERIGDYGYPCSTESFFDDLHSLLRRLHGEDHRRPAGSASRA